MVHVGSSQDWTLLCLVQRNVLPVDRVTRVDAAQHHGTQHGRADHEFHLKPRAQVTRKQLEILFRKQQVQNRRWCEHV